MLYLNTDFAAPQLRDVCEREGVTLLVHDQEYDRLMEGIEPAHGRVLAWTDEPGGADTLEALIEAHAGQTPEAPGEPSRVVLLTSGTTGTPKGAPREQGHSLHADRGAALEGPVPPQASRPTWRRRCSTGSGSRRWCWR